MANDVKKFLLPTISPRNISNNTKFKSFKDEDEIEKEEKKGKSKKANSPPNAGGGGVVMMPQSSTNPFENLEMTQAFSPSSSSSAAVNPFDWDFDQVNEVEKNIVEEKGKIVPMEKKMGTKKLSKESIKSEESIDDSSEEEEEEEKEEGVKDYGPLSSQFVNKIKGKEMGKHRSILFMESSSPSLLKARIRKNEEEECVEFIHESTGDRKRKKQTNKQVAN